MKSMQENLKRKHAKIFLKSLQTEILELKYITQPENRVEGFSDRTKKSKIKP